MDERGHEVACSAAADARNGLGTAAEAEGGAMGGSMLHPGTIGLMMAIMLIAERA